MVLPLAHVGSGTWEPLQLVPPTAAIVAYALRARTLAASGRPVPVRRQLSFAAGMVLVFASLVSPVAHIGGELVLAHMAQHLVMADLGALLIVLGLTGLLLQPLLALRFVGRLRFLAHPGLALALCRFWLCGAASPSPPRGAGGGAVRLWPPPLFVGPLPALYQAALNSQA